MHYPDHFETIIFDLGGVLVDWNPRYLYRKLFTDESAMESFLAEVTTSHWNEQQDAGRPLQEATELLIQRYPQFHTEIEAFYGRWPEMLNGAIDESVKILETLVQQGRHRLYALTNWSHETWPIALDLFPFLQLFEGILVSGVEKCIKPDPVIYELLLSRYNINRQKALFIDDNIKNVEGAWALGLPAIQFESPAQLNAFLIQQRIVAH